MGTRARLSTRRLAPVLALAAAYFVAGKLGLSLQLAHGNVTPVWPPTGISLAAMLLFGRSLWPGVTLGAFLVNVTTPAPLAFTLLAAIGNTAAVLAAYALCRTRGGVGSLDHFDQVVLLVIASLASPFVSATVGSTALWLTHAVPWADVRATWWVWWLGDSLGFLIVTPLILAWARGRHAVLRERGSEAAALGVLLLVGNLLAFGPWNVGSLSAYPLAYAVLPFVVWAALRFGQPGATLATTVTSGFALWGALRGYGPLAQVPQNELLLLWQGFSAVAGITSLVIAGTASERDRAEAELRRNSSDLERMVLLRTAELKNQSDQMKEFSYSIAHDLRAPLRAIRGYVDALAEEIGAELRPDARGYVGRVGEATSRMDALITSLLDYSRLGNANLAHEPMPLARVVHDAVTQLGPELRERRARVDVRLDGGLPPVLGHRPTLVQAVTNVIHNAVKFVPADRDPEVRIEAERRDDHVRLWIADNGIGISREHQDRIFRAFERLHSEDVYGGTGIGLAIVKRAIERMGGQVGVDSDLGLGSRFWMELPIARGVS